MAWDLRQQGQALLEKLKGLDKKSLILISLPYVCSLVILLLIGLQFAEMRRLKGELQRLDQQIAVSLEAERRFKPLSPKQKEAQSRIKAVLSSLIPKEKRALELAEDLARIASKRGMSSFTLKEPEKSLVIRRGEEPAPPPQGTEVPGVNYYLLHLSMRTRYRDLGYFLEEVSRLPRLVRMESLEAVREPPHVKAEIVLRCLFLP